ncbi:hypothetical protein CsSME_00024835 [Camellia sinensis var. sinensis]
MPPLRIQPHAAHVDPVGLGHDAPLADTTPGPANPPAPVFMTRADYEALHQDHFHLHLHLQQSVDTFQTDFYFSIAI